MEGLVKFEDLPEEDEVIDNIPSTIINVRNEDAEEMDEVIDEPISIVTSQEYTDALQRLSLNSWDIVAWRIYLEEVKEKKSGSVSVVEGYEKFLNKFPRAFRVWKELAEHYNFCGNISQAQEIFDQIKSKCRDVDVWRSYLLFFKNQLSKTTVTKSTVELSLEYYDKIKKEYEKAIDNVGMSVDAYQIWRDYIDLVKEEIEKTKNTEILRQLYHRALSVPMEGLEFIWKEYEAWETVPDKVVEDFKHAKAIFKDRKKLTSPIDFQRLAVPPTRSLNETVQLDHWNNWIRYEKKNPDNLSPIKFQSFMRMVYEQCLRSMLFFPEVWLSYAKFIMDTCSVSEAITAYEQAIDVLPDVMFLRISLAELEEQSGQIENARKVLRKAFLDMPSGYSFSIFQRFLRRVDGIIGARKFFSETRELRKDKKLAYEICLADAEVELDCNCSPQIALKVLEIARSVMPSAILQVPFVRLQMRSLVRLGDLCQLQWVMETSIQELTSMIASHTVMSSFTSSTTNITPLSSVPYASILDSDAISAHLSTLASSTDGGVDVSQLLLDRYNLCEDFLYAESLLGLSDIVRLNRLRQLRDESKLAYESFETSKSMNATGSSSSASTMLLESRQLEIFYPGMLLSERYELPGCNLPSIDRAMTERNQIKKLVHILTKQNIENLSASHFSTTTGSSTVGNASGSLSTALSGVNGSGAGVVVNSTLEDLNNQQYVSMPKILKELLFDLPSYQGPMPDIDYCLGYIGGFILPARPSDEDVVKNNRVEEEEEQADSWDKRDDEFRRRKRQRYLVN